MGMMKKKWLECCTCISGTGCPCCPGWPQEKSANIDWTVTVLPNDCEGPGATVEIAGDFSCEDVEDPEGAIIWFGASHLSVKVKCKIDPLTGSYRWVAEYRSAVSGVISGQGPFSPPISPFWAEAEDLEFDCPDCATGGIGTLDFTAQLGCETSGGITYYPAMVHGEITVGC
jgi:hypothetical protein